MNELAASYEITSRSGSSFRYSFFFLPREKRDAITAVYAFCRVVDDVVDEEGPADEKSRRLQHWRSEIGRCYEGKNPGEPIAKALLPAIKRFTLPRRHFEAIVDGCQMDLEKNRYENFEELERYCYHVAGAVGLLCIEIFGYESPRVRDYALALGTALQLTNILRDVGSDYRRGRIYLPRDEMEKYGVTEAAIAAAKPAGDLLKLLEFQRDRAKSYYERAQKLLPPEERSKLAAAEIMGAAYAALLTEIERAGFDVFSKKVSVPKFRQMFIALRAFWRTRFS